jgi:hypothetical protein
MRLNPDCVRDILLYVEEKSNCKHSVAFELAQNKASFPPLEQYTIEELRYHIMQCKMAGLLIIHLQDLGGNIYVKDLTPTGHEFLANIRQDSIWNNVKNVSAKVGSSSLSTLTQIAANIVTEIVKSQFGLR